MLYLLFSGPPGDDEFISRSTGWFMFFVVFEIDSVRLDGSILNRHRGASTNRGVVAEGVAVDVNAYVGEFHRILGGVGIGGSSRCIAL